MNTKNHSAEVSASGHFTPEQIILEIEKIPGEVRSALIQRLMLDQIEPLKQRLIRALETLDPEQTEIGGAPLPTITQVVDWLAPGCPEKVAFLYIRTCQTYGLNPYRRQIKLIPRNKKIKTPGKPDRWIQTWAIVVDYRVYIAYAKKDPRYDYFNAKLIYPGGDQTKSPIGAYIDIFMKGKEKPFHWEVDARELKQEWDMWRKDGGSPKHMLLKTVIKQGHELFAPEYLAGLGSVDSGLEDLSGKTGDQVDDILSPPPSERITPPPDEQFFTGESEPATEIPKDTPKEPPPEPPAAPAKKPTEEDVPITRSLKEQIKEMVTSEFIRGDQY